MGDVDAGLACDFLETRRQDLSDLQEAVTLMRAGIKLGESWSSWKIIRLREITARFWNLRDGEVQRRPKTSSCLLHVVSHTMALADQQATSLDISSEHSVHDKWGNVASSYEDTCGDKRTMVAAGDIKRAKTVTITVPVTFVTAMLKESRCSIEMFVEERDKVPRRVCRSNLRS